MIVWNYHYENETVGYFDEHQNRLGPICIGAVADNGFANDYSSEPKPFYTVAMTVKKDTNNLGIRGMFISLSGVDSDDNIVKFIDGNHLDDTYTSFTFVVNRFYKPDTET